MWILVTCYVLCNRLLRVTQKVLPRKVAGGHLEGCGSDGSGDGFRVGTLPMVCLHPCGAHNCFLLTSLRNAEKQKEGEENSGSFKFTWVTKDGDCRVTWKRALYTP